MSSSRFDYGGATASAVRSPRGLLRDVAFWRHHLDFVAVIAAGVLAATLLLSPTSLELPFDIVPEAANGSASAYLGWLTLSLIALIGLWALGSSALGLAETQVETSIATVVEADADRWLASLHQAPTERIELSALRAMIPANRTKPEPAMIRLFQEILKEARNLRLDARFHLLPRYVAESMAHVHRLERLQKYALRLGILGTFLGLILALGGFAPILAASGGTGASAPNSLLATGGHELVESLRLSFGTSIAGLAVALFIAAQAELLRNRQAAYFRIMEDACHSLTALAGRTLQREDLLAGLEASTQALREVQAQLYDQSRKVENGLEALDARIGQQIAGVEQGVKHLNGMRQAWELQLTGMQQGVDDLLRGMHQISEHPSLDRLGEDLRSLEGELEQRLAEELGRGFDRLVTGVDTLTTRVGRVDEALGHQTAELQTRMDGLVTTAGTIRDHVLAAAESSQRSLKEVPVTLSGLRERLDDARRDGLTLLDAGMLKTTLLGCTVGLLLGITMGEVTTALAGLVLGPWVAYAVTHFRRAR